MVSLSTSGAADPIDAVRRPLFVMLLVNAVALLMIVIAAVLRPQWPAVADLVAEWMR